MRYQFPLDWMDRPYEERLAIVRNGLQRLRASIAEQCPGPHQYVQHRDLRPPWCEACAFCDNGLHRSDFGHGRGSHLLIGRSAIMPRGRRTNG